MTTTIEDTSTLPLLDAQEGRSKAQRVRPLPEEVVNRLAAYKASEGITDAQLGQRLGLSGTMVNRALNGDFRGSTEEFIAKTEDFFLHEPDRRERVGNLFPTTFTKRQAAFFEKCRRTQEMGLAFAASGKGKTAGCNLYAQATPLTTLVTVRKLEGGAFGMLRLLWGAVDTRSYRREESRTDFLVKRFKKSPRLIIVDNANRITRGGWQWLMDFYNECGNPIALVAHTDVLDVLENDDQSRTRVQHWQEIQGGNAEDDTRKMIEVYWPEAAGKLGTLPMQVLKQEGHMRSLRAQLLNAKDMAGSGAFKSCAEAFRAAHTQMHRSYTLTEDEE